MRCRFAKRQNVEKVSKLFAQSVEIIDDNISKKVLNFCEELRTTD